MDEIASIYLCCSPKFAFDTFVMNFIISWLNLFQKTLSLIFNISKWIAHCLITLFNSLNRQTYISRPDSRLHHRQWLLKIWTHWSSPLKTRWRLTSTNHKDLTFFVKDFLLLHWDIHVSFHILVKIFGVSDSEENIRKDFSMDLPYLCSFH